MPERPRVLVVDDDAALRFTLGEILESAGLEAVLVGDGLAGLARLREERFDLVLSDLRMPRMDGMQLLRESRTLEPPPRVILITAHGSERHAVEAMKAGAWDYFRKPFELEELLAVVGRATEAARLQHDNERLKGVLALARTMIFTSAAMERLAVLAARVAPRDVTVLIRGESGTGKERVAEAIVAASARAGGPFVRFNCAALPGELAEAELFGHKRGAFTGASRDRPGLFREAHGGTLLLDEVGELSLDAQAKLLRVLQEGEVRPVGEDRAQPVDVRILAATHRDLRARVEAGAFREDLFWRLNVVELAIPPLRERPEDIAPLARHFLEHFARRFGTPLPPLGAALLDRLRAHRWPGNVRELEHTIERLVILSPPGALDLSLLPGAAATDPGGLEPLSLRQRVEAYERGIIAEALQATGGNRSEAARRLGTSRVTLLDKLRKYGLGDDDTAP